jgi:ATP-dependent Lon protease
VVLQGMQRIKLKNIVGVQPYLLGNAELMPEVLPASSNKEFKAIIASCKDAAVKYVKLSALISFLSSVTCTALTEPTVPTGMNMGVSITPCPVVILPALALLVPSVC